MDIEAIRKELRSKRIEEIPLRVTYYARVSTDSEEQLVSSVHQVQYFPEKIKSHKNWTYVEGYVDEGVTGTSTRHRAGFNRMIEDAKAGKFDLILTKEISRFARNTIDGISYSRDLLRRGVAIIFENDGINTLDGDGELRLTIMLGVAQDESRKISSRVKFGHKQSIKHGHVLGTDNMYGYIKKDAKLTIDPTTAPMVQRIFEMYASERYSLNGISKELYADGWKSRTGTPISTRTLHNIIMNPKYKGYFAGGKVEVVDMFTKQQHFLPQEEWVMFKDENGNVPAIVSEQLWEEANAVMAKRSKQNKARQGAMNMHNTFTSKIKCEDCGETFYKKENRLKDGRKVARWTCSGKINKKICSNLDVYEDELTEIIADLINTVNVDAEYAAQLYAGLLESAREGSDTDKRRAELMSELEKLAQQKERMIKLNLAGSIDDEALLDVIKSNKKLEKELLEELNSLPSKENMLGDVGETVETLRSLVTKAKTDLREGFIDRRFVEKYIDHIGVRKLDDKRVEINVYLANLDVRSTVLQHVVRNSDIFLTM